MDNEAKIKVLENVLDAAYGGLEAGDPGGLKDMVEAINGMEFLVNTLRAGNMEFMPTAECLAEQSEPEKPKAAAPAPEPCEEPDPEPEECMSKEDLRALVSALSNKYPNLNAFAVMQSMGYSRLSDIPAGKRAEYRRRIEAAVAEVK